MKQHTYEVRVDWTGNDGEGTRTRTSYRRDYILSASGKPFIPGSSDPAFRGDTARYNPEELLLASLSSCHMLWYLHLCSANGITVVEYRDAPLGTMAEQRDGSGEFVRAELRPEVKLSIGADCDKALLLHEEAHRYCFIARSVNFPIDVVPQITAQKEPC